MKRSREPEQEPSDQAQPGRGTADNGLKSSSIMAADEDAATSQQPASKIIELDLAETMSTPSDGSGGGNSHGSSIEIRCSLPPHQESLVFTTYQEYEAHYNQTHTNRCLECRKNFPSAHLLGLHIEEVHDAFAAVKRDRGERTYSCFVQGCDRKCSTPQKRKMHLIDKHMYPKEYFFAVTRDGIDGRHSMLSEGRRYRHRKPSVAASMASSAAAKPEKPETETPKEETSTEEAAVGTVAAETGKQKQGQNGPLQKQTLPEELNDVEMENKDQPQPQPWPAQKQKQIKEPVDVEMDDLAGAMSALRFVPSSVRFGRGGRKGFAKR
ncbi:hypothetical protein B0H66DRAFT_537105 [Apodospora peruviana]|uniref:C2H2-type domain-containing protein n=1 Tax=Apodospora peruviana TaxID=516989 RepID=A0AAE0HVU3_9PEZI|nr:hypothetical protein B0H66DRAFT_537105 [Apodospora peruviana]